MFNEHYFQYNLIEYAIDNKRDIYFYYTLHDNKKIKVFCQKIESKNKSIDNVIQNISNEMTKIILKNPEQYLWNYNIFN